jgi:hypothetical protein
MTPSTAPARSPCTRPSPTKYGCDKLDRESRDAAPFSLSLAVGDRYRIRGDYVGGKDTANLSAQGPWRYFTVTK